MAVELSDGHVHLTFAIRDLTLAVEHYRLRAARAAFGVGATEMMALSHLFTIGQSSPTELARCLSITTASVTDLIDRLERAGHVTRRRHPEDRRRIIVELTVPARQRITAMFARASAATGRAAHRLTPTEQAVVARFLRAAAREYDQMDPVAPGTLEPRPSRPEHPLEKPRPT